MKFFKTLFRAITDKTFYSEIISGEHKVRSGFWFVFKIQVLAALFMTILLSISLSAFIPWLKTSTQSILEPGTEIVIKDGVLRSNTNPIVVSAKDVLPPGSSDLSMQSATSTTEMGITQGNSRVKNLIVVDTTASTTIAALVERDTYVLVTQEGIVSRGDQRGKVTINTFEMFKGEEIRINRDWLIGKAAWISNFAKFVPFIAFIFFLIVFYIGSVIASLIYGLITMLIFALMKHKQSFSTSLKVGLYSRAFATVLGIIGFIIPVIRENIFLMPLEIIFIFYMIKDIRFKGVNTADKDGSKSEESEKSKVENENAQDAHTDANGN